jgi:hypothetical protein
MKPKKKKVAKKKKVRRVCCSLCGRACGGDAVRVSRLGGKKV